MVVLDTNFLFSLFIQKDPLFEQANSIFRELPDNEKFIIPYIVVAELLISGENFPFFENLEAIVSGFSEMKREDLDFIDNLPVATKRSLKANDCAILAITKRYKARLFTFDRSLQKVANSLYIKVFD